MPLPADEHQEIRRNPINREKYVRDKIRYKSKAKAVRIQKPYISPNHASQVAARLELEPVVQRLSAGIEQAMIDLNAKRLFVITKSMDSDDEKIQMDGAKEAGKVISQYQDRVLGKSKQSVEIRTTKLTISLDMTGKEMNKTAEVLDAEEEILDAIQAGDE